MMNKFSAKILTQKFLADRLVSLIGKTNARFVQIVSPGQGDGKTTYFEMVQEHILPRYPGEFLFLSLAELCALDPWSIPSHVVVIIDGPALNQGIDSVQIPQEWQEATDSAVIVVTGRQTTDEEMKECLARLEAMETRCLGVVVNERLAPSWAARKQMLGESVRRIFARGLELDAPGDGASARPVLSVRIRLPLLPDSSQKPLTDPRLVVIPVVSEAAAVDPRATAPCRLVQERTARPASRPASVIPVSIPSPPRTLRCDPASSPEFQIDFRPKKTLAKYLRKTA